MPPSRLWALGCLAALACSGEGIEVEPPGTTGISLTYSYVYVDIKDLAGEYRIFAILSTDLEALIGGVDISAWDSDGYASVIELVELDTLVVEEGEVDEELGLPRFTYRELAQVTSINCEIAVDGEAIPAITRDGEPPSYTLEGTVTMDCFGEKVTLDVGHWYDEPGELVGQATGDFLHEVL